MITVDLNCDVGEGTGNDAVIMPYISSANIACGYHAGSDEIMEQTIHLALEHSIAIGAHPGYDDKENFGRIPLEMSPESIRQIVQEQIQILRRKVERAGGKLAHVKPHGALYNQAAKDLVVARAIAKAISAEDPKLLYVGLANSAMLEAAKEYGLQAVSEVFADRAYTNEGFLVPRSRQGAVIEDAGLCKERVISMVNKQVVASIDSIKVGIKAETICIHGDNAKAIELAKSIHRALIEDGVVIQSTRKA